MPTQLPKPPRLRKRRIIPFGDLRRLVERVQLVVRIPAETMEKLDFAVSFFNAVDEGADIRRPRAWNRTSVIERFVNVCLAELWEEIGREPHHGEKPEALVKLALANMPDGAPRNRT